MFFVGIDIAKRSHQVAVTNDSADIIVKPFNIKNSTIGFSNLIGKLVEYSITQDNCIYYDGNKKAYQIKGNKRFNALKYVQLYYLY